MSRKDKDQLNEQEPWDQPIFEEEFGNDDDSSSRTDRRFKEEGKNWYVIILVVLLFLIVLIPTSTVLYLKTGSNMNKGTEKQENVIVESSSKEKVTETSSSTKTSDTSSETEGSSVVNSGSSSSTSTTSSTFKDVEVSPDEAQNNQNVVPEGAETAGPGSAVTFGEGENISIWRIAQNNGVTEEQIYQLNPGLDPNNIQPGQQIRIK